MIVNEKSGSINWTTKGSQLNKLNIKKIQNPIDTNKLNNKKCKNHQIDPNKKCF